MQHRQFTVRIIGGEIMGKMDFLFKRKFWLAIAVVLVAIIALYALPQTRPYIESTLGQTFAVIGATTSGFTEGVMATPTFIMIAPYWPYISTLIGFGIGILFMRYAYQAYIAHRRAMVQSSLRDAGYQGAPQLQQGPQVLPPKSIPQPQEKPAQ
jgi:hypothetical protein